MSKYCVTVARFGNIYVEAETGEEAMDIADRQTTDIINWSDDWVVTDYLEDDTLDDCKYIKKKTFE